MLEYNSSPLPCKDFIDRAVSKLLSKVLWNRRRPYRHRICQAFSDCVAKSRPLRGSHLRRIYDARDKPEVDRNDSFRILFASQSDAAYRSQGARFGATLG